jgi:membrane associated rhomboid family serine protease
VAKKHPETRHWFRTFTAPLLGGLGMLYVIWLLIQSASVAAGSATSDVVFTLTPWIVGAAAVGGLVFALAARYLAPRRYEIIGRVVLDDAHERD